MSSSQPNPPGKGLLGWLGRQIGYVSKAVATDVTAPPKLIYRERRVEEAPHPEDPEITLRRTTIDEALPSVPPQKR